jgi:hypothetical protein
MADSEPPARLPFWFTPAAQLLIGVVAGAEVTVVL